MKTCKKKSKIKVRNLKKTKITYTHSLVLRWLGVVLQVEDEEHGWLTTCFFAVEIASVSVYEKPVMVNDLTQPHFFCP